MLIMLIIIMVLDYFFAEVKPLERKPLVYKMSYCQDKTITPIKIFVKFDQDILSNKTRMTKSLSRIFFPADIRTISDGLQDS